MKNKNTLLSLTIGGILSLSVDALAQTPATASAFLDINNIKANHQTNGVLWFSLNPYGSSCEFPKGSGKHINSATSIWISGTDAQNNQCVSTQTFGISGNDFWPGPLNGFSPISNVESNKWARIWKINLTDLEDFVDLPTHTIANTKKDILEWPALGNPYAKGNNNESLSILKNMAPFVDENNDGIYNALDGDYPLIKGDQMLWWVMNDYGPTHDATGGQSLKVEIKVIAYAYNAPKVKNALFYEYELNSAMGAAYDDFRFGLFSNADLGNPYDDYVGFDSSRRMAILYNASAEDGSGAPFEYGSHVPMTGITFLETAGSNGNKNEPMGSFVKLNPGEQFNTTNAFNNLLRSKHSNGMPLTVPCGPHLGNTTTYDYPGDLKDSLGLTECYCNSTKGDRMFVIASNDYKFTPHIKPKYAFALLVTDTVSGLSCGGSFNKLQGLADYAYEGYHLGSTTGVNEFVKTPVSLKVYPNPATEQLFIENDRQDLRNASIVIYDGLGRALHLPMNLQGNKMEVDIHSLPNGVYTLLYSNGGKTSSNVFVVKH